MSGLPYWPSPGLFCFSSIALFRPWAKCLFFVQGRCPACHTGLHRSYFVSAALLCSGYGPSAYSSSSFSTAIKASVGSCTLPRLRIFFLFPRKSFFFCGDPFDCTGSGQMNCPCALRRTCAAPLCGAPGKKKMNYSSSSFSTAIKASVGSCTLPRLRIFFLPSFCFSSSFFFRVMSPP